MERLDKRLASTGKWSRKEAKELIRAGRVTVEEAVCRDPETKVGPEDSVRVDDLPLEDSGPVWIMLHKPAGVVSATEDGREQTVLDLLPEQYRKLGLFPVGRLDKDTEGLLLLTDDGPTAHWLLSPRHHVDKVYYAEVDGELDETDCVAFQNGVALADGYTCMPAELRLESARNSAFITLHEGKYHQIKRMLASRGKPVTYLKRVRFGPLELDSTLEKGRWRALTEEEKNLLFRH